MRIRNVHSWHVCVHYVHKLIYGKQGERDGGYNWILELLKGQCDKGRWMRQKAKDVAVAGVWRRMLKVCFNKKRENDKGGGGWEGGIVGRFAKSSCLFVLPPFASVYAAAFYIDLIIFLFTAQRPNSSCHNPSLYFPPAPLGPSESIIEPWKLSVLDFVSLFIIMFSFFSRLWQLFWLNCQVASAI